MDVLTMVLMVLTGAVVGVLGGLLGVGGSIIMLPAMIWILGTTFNGQEGLHQYQATAMIVNFLLILPAVRVHARNKAIWMGVWKVLAPMAIVGVVLGVWLSYLPQLSGHNTVYMRYLMGVFFLSIALQEIWRMLPRCYRREEWSREQAEALPWWRKASVGFPMGFLAGLLGIGGGMIAVPLQQSVLRMPLRSSVATSAATIMCVSWIGAILKNVELGVNGSWHTSLLLAALLTPTAMIGANFGGHLTHKLPLWIVRLVLIVVQVASAYTFFRG